MKQEKINVRKLVQFKQQRMCDWLFKWPFLHDFIVKAQLSQGFKQDKRDTIGQVQ